MELSREIVENKLADYASVFILSQIGKPISDPQLIHLKLKNNHAFQNQIEDLVKAKLNELPSFWKNLLNQ